VIPLARCEIHNKWRSDVTKGSVKQGPTKRPKRAALAQSDVPAFAIEEAIRVPRAIADEYGKRPATPIDIGKALKMSPTGSTFRMLASASAAYGLTEGSAWAESISLSPLGRRAVAPTLEGDDLQARREAVLRPRVVREFLNRYKGSKWPRQDIGENVLEDLGVPTDQKKRALELIKSNALAVGFLTDIGGSTYVQLKISEVGVGADSIHLESDPDPTVIATEQLIDLQPDGAEAEVAPDENRRVFITHGKNRGIAQQLKELLTYGTFEPIMSVEQDSTAKPVPDKVLDEMRKCGAAIIHVGTERLVVDQEGNEHLFLNQNVLIEIGAALALYGRKFILLVETGVQLPSNLQGLYEVRYTGERLDYDATMKLLRAFNDFKMGD
jgi:hypothetical protein